MRRLRVCREPGVQPGLLGAAGGRQVSSEQVHALPPPSLRLSPLCPGGFQSRQAMCELSSELLGVFGPRAGHVELNLWLQPGSGAQSKVGVQDSSLREGNGRPAPPGSRRGAGNVERTGNENHQGQSNRQRRAGLTLLGALRRQCQPHAHQAGGSPEPLFVVWVIVARLWGG